MPFMFIFLIIFSSQVYAGSKSTSFKSESPRRHDASEFLLPDQLVNCEELAEFLGPTIYLEHGRFLNIKNLTSDDNLSHHIEDVISTKAIYLQSMPVTQAQYDRVRGFQAAAEKINPSDKDAYKKVPDLLGPNKPMVGLSPNDWHDYIIELNSNLTTFWRTRHSKSLWNPHVRLPTEPELKYAMTHPAQYVNLPDGTLGTGVLLEHSGTDSKEDSECSNFVIFNRPSEDSACPVGTKNPNARGFYDLNGNIWQLTNSIDPFDDSSFLILGGAWYLQRKDCRSVSCSSVNKSFKLRDMGARLVLEWTNFTDLHLSY